MRMDAHTQSLGGEAINAKITGAVVGTNESFTIKSSPVVFDILSSTLYKDPVKAIVRELICNAMDSCIRAGTDPYKGATVHVPSSIEPWFEVKDRGVGLTHEGVMSNYTCYFGSDKSGTDSEVGGFGLGCKTPFSYTDQFVVTTKVKGEDSWRVYSCYRDDNREPRVVLLSSILSEGDTEASGLTVQVPLKNSYDSHTFLRSIEYVMNGMKGYFVGLSEDHYTLWDQFSKGLSNVSSSGEIHVMCGCVIYTVGLRALLQNTPEDWTQKVGDINLLNKLCLLSPAIEVPIGSVLPTPSREDLHLSLKTKETIIDALLTSGLPRLKEYREVCKELGLDEENPTEDVHTDNTNVTLKGYVDFLEKFKSYITHYSSRRVNIWVHHVDLKEDISHQPHTSFQDGRWGTFVESSESPSILDSMDTTTFTTQELEELEALKVLFSGHYIPTPYNFAYSQYAGAPKKSRGIRVSDSGPFVKILEAYGEWLKAQERAKRSRSRSGKPITPTQKISTTHLEFGVKNLYSDKTYPLDVRNSPFISTTAPQGYSLVLKVEEFFKAHPTGLILYYTHDESRCMYGQETCYTFKECLSGVERVLVVRSGPSYAKRLLALSNKYPRLREIPIQGRRNPTEEELYEEFVTKLFKDFATKEDTTRIFLDYAHDLLNESGPEFSNTLHKSSRVYRTFTRLKALAKERHTSNYSWSLLPKSTLKSVYLSILLARVNRLADKLMSLRVGKGLELREFLLKSELEYYEKGGTSEVISSKEELEDVLNSLKCTL